MSNEGQKDGKKYFNKWVVNGKTWVKKIGEFPRTLDAEYQVSIIPNDPTQPVVEIYSNKPEVLREQRKQCLNSVTVIDKNYAWVNLVLSNTKEAFDKFKNVEGKVLINKWV